MNNDESNDTPTNNNNNDNNKHNRIALQAPRKKLARKNAPNVVSPRKQSTLPASGTSNEHAEESDKEDTKRVRGVLSTIERKHIPRNEIPIYARKVEGMVQLGFRVKDDPKRNCEK